MKKWLSECGLAAWASVFYENGYETMKDVKSFTPQELTAMKMLPGHVKRLMRKLEEVEQQGV